MSDTVEHDFRQLAARLRRERETPAPRPWLMMMIFRYGVREIGPTGSHIVDGRYVTPWGSKRAAARLAAELPGMVEAGYSWRGGVKVA